MTTGGAPAHAGLAVSRGRECGRSLLVTPRRGGLRAREAHGGCQGGTRQQRRDNDAQHKTHDASPFSVFTLTHKGMFRMQRRGMHEPKQLVTGPAVMVRPAYRNDPISLISTAILWRNSRGRADQRAR
jgi:hypothetical protein